MAAEDTVADTKAAAATPRTLAATPEHTAGTAELTSEYRYMPASAYTVELGWAYAAELAWAAATTAASGMAPDDVGTAVAGGLTASAVAGEPLRLATFGSVVEGKIYSGAVLHWAAKEPAP